MYGQVWTKIDEAAQNREKQEWEKEKTRARQCSKNDGNLLY